MVVALFIILSLCLLFNYNKTVIFVAVFYTLIAAFSLWGQNLALFVIVFAIALFPLKLKLTNVLLSFPPLYVFILLAISIIISGLLATEHHYPSIISRICTQLVFCLIVWYVYKKSPILFFKCFSKYALIFGSLVGLYSLFETILNYNPYMQYIAENKFYTTYTIISEVRFGIKRSQGLFDVHVTNGCMSLTMLMIIYYSVLSKYIKRTKFVSTIMLVLFIVPFLSGARSAIIAAVIMIPCFIYEKTPKIKLFFLSLALIACVIVFFDYFYQIFDSIINSNEAKIGSDQDMRERQFSLAFYFMEKSLLFGNGTGYTFGAVRNFSSEILGAESLWLPIIIEQGLVGCLSYIILFLYSVFYFLKKKQTKIAIFIISFWIFNTLTSIHNCSPTYILLYSLIIYEMSKYKVSGQNKLSHNRNESST